MATIDEKINTSGKFLRIVAALGTAGLMTTACNLQNMPTAPSKTTGGLHVVAPKVEKPQLRAYIGMPRIDMLDSYELSREELPLEFIFHGDNFFNEPVTDDLSQATQEIVGYLNKKFGALPDNYDPKKIVSQSAGIKNEKGVVNRLVQMVTYEFTHGTGKAKLKSGAHPASLRLRVFEHPEIKGAYVYRVSGSAKGRQNSAPPEIINSGYIYIPSNPLYLSIPLGNVNEFKIKPNPVLPGAKLA